MGYVCHMRCEYLRKLSKIPGAHGGKRSYSKGDRTCCTNCEVSFYGVTFPNNRCMCCGAKMRLKKHSGRRRLVEVAAAV